ncbi:hypothetical protein lerEdw1_007292 [Lerista edwardsae]|nr:hypothetical protein lerEdw1_007292 [Lerista edwardsae]
MSWPGEEWKVGLPSRALKAIAEVEQRLERLQKERQQRQVQFDTLEAKMHKQRQKHEEERTSWALLSQQNRSLAETCDQTERARQRLAQDLQAKEAQLSCLVAQLAQATRRQAELEEELRRCQAELDSLHSRPQLALLPPRWGSPAPWAEGSVEAKAETSWSLTPAVSPVQRSCPPLGGAGRSEYPIICWQQEAVCPSAPPGSPVPTENGEGIRPVASELESTSARLKEDNQELRLSLAKAETLKQEKEKELRRLRGELELIRSELAQSKKHQGDQKEAAPREIRERRRLSEDVGQSRNQQKQGQLVLERLPPSGSHRSFGSYRQEQAGEKKGATTKAKGSLLPIPRAQSTDQSRDELQSLKAEILVLRQGLEASESRRKALLETCLQPQQQKSQVRAQERPVLARGTLPQQETREFSESLGDGDRTWAAGKAEDSGKVETDREEAAKEPEAPAEETGELEVQEAQLGLVSGTGQAHGETTLLAAGEGLPKHPEVTRVTGSEGDLQALQGELRALASGKAEAEAQAGLAQQKLQSLQAMLGSQTERLAQAMETQKRHVEELLADAEEKDRLLKGLSQELEETQKELDKVSAERRHLQALLGCGDGVRCVEIAEPSTEAVEAPKEKPPTRALEDKVSPGAEDGLAEHLQEDKQRQLEAPVAQLVQENQALREELVRWESWRRGGGNAVTVIGPLEVGHSREAGSTEEAAQKREPLLQGSSRDAQTQTDGSYRGRRERVSVAFDDTQYEPYGLPEVVMKGFADIPSGPSCPYVLRRGILGSAPVAQLAPRAEPEEDSPEAEEGTGV